MLDVHILISADTRQSWVNRCRASVAEAALWAGYPVAVHEMPAVPGHIGLARKAGYAQGHHAYCTYVDDDDHITPDAFAVLRSAIDAAVRLAFTAEWLEQNGKFAGIAKRHHLSLVRREDAMAHNWQAYPHGGEAELYRTLGEPMDIDAVVYTHRLYRSKGRALRGGLSD